MKQTAVEWLEEQMQKYTWYDEDGFPHVSISPINIDEAKKMEKEQRMEDYSVGYSNGQVNSNRTAKQYYNETFKSE